MRIISQSVCLALLLVLPLGCGRRSNLQRKVIEGDVTCGGDKVAQGMVRFVPIDDTQGPVTVAIIIDGHYRTFNRGGVPLGKHRVEIQARRATGKKIESPEGKLVDETVPVGSKEYAASRSPLSVEVTADGEARFDFDIPE